jgi:hypothetical protein
MIHRTGKLEVILSDGSPFAATRETTVLESIGLAAGDIDQDGDIDLVYTSGPTLGALLGAGNGTFADGSTATTGGGFVALGDVNGDGKLDAVTFGQFSHGISVNLGDGHGGFAADVRTSSNLEPAGIAVANLNGDAKAEVLVMASGMAYRFSAQSNGTLQEDGTVAVGAGAGAFALARINDDTYPDLVALTIASGAPAVRVVYNTGAGTFWGDEVLPLPGLPSSGGLECADVDGDGDLDIVAMVGGIVTTFRNAGNLSAIRWPVVPQYSPGRPNSKLLLGDFDHDGKTDLLTLWSTVRADLQFLKGNGDGTFGGSRVYQVPAPGKAANAIEGGAIDVTLDNGPDVVALLPNASGGLDLGAMRNDGTGALLPPVLTPTGIDPVNPSMLVLGQLNDDLRGDAVVLGSVDGVWKATVFGAGLNGYFGHGASVALAAAVDPQVRPSLADVTGDGEADLLIGNHFYTNDGTGAFGAAQARAVTFRVTGDVDGNGTLDAIGFSGSDPRLALALNGGGGTFGVPVWFGDGQDTPLVLADFNGDGDLDLFCAVTSPSAIRVYLGRGDGTFLDPLILYGNAAGLRESTAADFDGDGHLDVAMGTLVLLGDGAGRFQRAEGAPVAALRAAVADFDGNGSPDLCSFGEVVAVMLSRLVPEPSRDLTLTAAVGGGPPEYGKPLYLIALFAAPPVPPNGVVVFRLDGVPFAIGTGSPMSLPPGTHILTATYAGDQTYRAATSAPLQVVVERATTKLTPFSYGGIYGQSVYASMVFTAPTQPGWPAPVRSFTISEGGATVATAVWNDTDVLLSGVNAGEHTFTVDYAGDANYKPSSSTFTMTVTKRLPPMTGQFSPAGAARIEGPVTATMTFAAGTYGATTGTVTFTYEGRPAVTVPVSGGRAEVTVTLPAGAYALSVAYSGDANNAPVTDNGYLIQVYNPPGRPIAVTADRNRTSGKIEVRWTPLPNVTSYVVYRRTSWAGSWVAWTTAPPSYPFAVDAPGAGLTRMYAVAPAYNNNPPDPRGVPDLVTNIALTDDPLSAGTRIKAVQITELRTAVNAVRTFAGLGAFSFTDASLQGIKLKALHITELRTALAAARNTIGMPVTFAETVAAQTKSKTTQVEEIRNGVR